MASRKRILKAYWWVIICFSTTGFLVILQWDVSFDQGVYSSERESRADTNASTEETLATSTMSTFITETIMTYIEGTKNEATTRKISTSKATSQKSTQSMTSSSTTEFDKTSTFQSSSPSTYDGYITSSPLTHLSTSEISTAKPKTPYLSHNFLLFILTVSFFGIIIGLLFALIMFCCSRLTTKQNNEQLEVSEDAWSEMELDETRLAANSENILKEQNVAETGIINSPKPRLSISSPTEMRYATVNQTFATFTPGPERFRKIRDRNSKTMENGVAKGLMYSEPDLLNNTIPSLKLSVRSPEDTLQWEPNVAYQGFNPRSYHSTENNFIGGNRDQFNDEYYAVIDM